MDLKVYDMGGRLVRTLADGNFAAGAHYFIWNARDRSGIALPPGLYAYRLHAGRHLLTRKTMLVR
jgi:flagellar hook assembly protein FlgD